MPSRPGSALQTEADPKEHEAARQPAGAGSGNSAARLGCSAAGEWDFPRRHPRKSPQLCPIATGDCGASQLLPASQQRGSASSCGRQLHEPPPAAPSPGNARGRRIRARSCDQIPHPSGSAPASSHSTAARPPISNQAWGVTAEAGSAARQRARGALRAPGPDADSLRNTHLLALPVARCGRPRASPLAAPSNSARGSARRAARPGGWRGGGGVGGSTWSPAARGPGRAFPRIGALPESRAGCGTRPRGSSEAQPGARGARDTGGTRGAPTAPAEALLALLRRELRKGSRRSRAREKAPRSERRPKRRASLAAARPDPLPAPHSRVPAAPARSGSPPARSSLLLPVLPPSAPDGGRAGLRRQRHAVPAPPELPRARARTRDVGGPGRPVAPGTHLQRSALRRRTAAPPRRTALPVGPPAKPALPLRTAPGGPRDAPRHGAAAASGARRSPSGFARWRSAGGERPPRARSSAAPACPAAAPGRFFQRARRAGARNP